MSSNGDTWVLLEGNGTHVFSGSRREAEEARNLRGTSDGPFLYSASDGRAYVSRDRALDRSREGRDEGAA